VAQEVSAQEIPPLESQGHNLFNRALDAMLIADDQGCYVEANPAACALLGATRAEIIGRTIADFCVLPPGINLDQQWQTFLAQGQMQGEISLRGSGGKVRVVEFSASAYFCPHFHLSILRDITDRQRVAGLKARLTQVLTQQVAERTRALQAVQTQLEAERSLVESILDNIDGVVWSVDLPTMATQYVNAAVKTIYGFAAEAFLADPDLWQSLIHPGDRPWLEQCLEQRYEQERFDLEYRIIRSDGDTRWVRDRARVIYDSAGVPVRLNRVTTDITEQKQLEEALRLSESRLRAIFEQAAIGINQAALDGRFLQVNQAYCKLLGYSETELLQLRYQDVAHPDEYQATEAALARLYAQEDASVTLEKRYFHKDGSVRWTNLVLSILRDADGEAISDIAIVQDISDRKQMEEELQRTKEFLEQTNTVARVGGWEVDLDQGTLYWTSITREIHEVEADFQPTLAAAIAFYCEGSSRQRIAALVEQARQTGQPWDVKLQIFTAKGNLRWVRSLGQAEFVDGCCVRLYGACQDVDAQMQAETRLQDLTQQLQQANEELNRLATTDALTHLANRRHFDQVLAQEWQWAQRHQTPLALIICDVDYFKPYNDHYGHLAGDRCLQQVAQLLKAQIQRPGDMLARYGGEEFVVLLPQTTMEGAIAVAARIKDHFSQARLPHGFSAVADHITMSFGIACGVPLAQTASSELLTAADAALYQAKLAGRNQYCISDNDPTINPKRHSP